MARRLYRVYVDESGDRSVSPSSSPFFVLAAVLVRDERDRELRALRDEMCANLGKPVGTVLHWSENIKKHDERKHVASLLGAADICRLSYVIVDKAKLRGATGVADSTRMYNYALRRLLERLSWCVDDQSGEAIITLAHVRRFQYATLTSYLALLQNSGTQIRWAAFHGTPQIDQPVRIRLLQLADIAAGCLYSALTPDAYGSLEPAYLERVASRIYRRPPGAITSYGMNIVGDAAAPGSLTTRLPWWSSIFP